MRCSMKLSENNKKTVAAYFCAVVMLILSATVGVSLGASGVGLGGLFDAVSGNISTSDARIFIYVRLPRVIAAVICGAALAVTGAVIQGVLANSLASPSIIGVSSGAGLAVTLCTALGCLGGVKLSRFSFIGAFCAVMLVTLLASRFGMSDSTLILVGVAMNSILGALSDAVITVFPESAVMSHDFRIGDFSFVTYQRLIPSAVIVLTVLVILFLLSSELDVLSLGEDCARSLGMNTAVMRALFLVLSALLSGCAVSVCGLLSFVGLIIPHAVRRMFGSGARHLLPLCALFGAGFVTLCDTLSRTVLSPYEIPVGIIMAFIGAPTFILILVKKRSSR